MNMNKITVFGFYDKLSSNVFPFLFLCAGIPCLNVMIDIKHYTAIA